MLLMPVLFAAQTQRIAEIVFFFHYFASLYFRPVALTLKSKNANQMDYQRNTLLNTHFMLIILANSHNVALESKIEFHFVQNFPKMGNKINKNLNHIQ